MPSAPRILDAPISVNELLFNDALRRAILFEGLKKTEAARVVDYANRHIFPGVLDHVERVALDVQGLTPVERLVPSRIRAAKDLDAYLASTVAEQYKGLALSQKERLADIGLAEAQFQVDSLRAHVPDAFGFSMKAPSVTAIRGIISGVPVDGKRIGQWYEDLAPALRDRVNRTLHSGILNGDSTDQLIRRVRGTAARDWKDGALQLSRHQAAVVTRTTMTHVSAQARELTARENASVIAGVQWVSTLDARTSPQCVALDQQVFEIDKGPRPPAHHQALPAGTLIRTARGEVPIEDVHVGDLVWTHRARWRPVTRVMARRWDAPLVELQLPTGRALRVTDEHPILTASGWKAGASLKTGDQVFQYVEDLPGALPPGASLVPQRVLIDAHDRPSELDEPLVAYEVSVAARGVSAAIQLEVNARLRKRNVAEPSPCLVDDMVRDGELAENAREPTFVVRRFSSVAWRTRGNGFFDDPGHAYRVAPTHARRGLPAHLGESFGVRPAVVAGGDARARAVEKASRPLGLASGLDAVLAAHSAQHAVRQPVGALDGAQRLASGDVSHGDQQGDVFYGQPRPSWHPTLLRSLAVVWTSSVAHSGFVFNLEVEEDETYVANSVVAHNCRSTVTFLTKSWQELGIKSKADTSPAERASMNGTVPAKTTYSQWLRKQPKDFQDVVLGPGRAKLWRANKIKLEQLVTADLRPRTLDELRKLKPGATRFPGLLQSKQPPALKKRKPRPKPAPAPAPMTEAERVALREQASTELWAQRGTMDPAAFQQRLWARIDELDGRDPLRWEDVGKDPATFFRTPDEALAERLRLQKAHALTSDDMAALEGWTRKDYQAVREFQQTGIDDELFGGRRSATVTRDLDAALGKLPDAKPDVLYRGIEIDRVDFDMRPGEVVTLDAHASTTLRPSVANSYPNGDGSRVIFEYRGARAKRVDAFSAHSWESEYILQKGERFRVAGISEYQDARVIRLERLDDVVPPSVPSPTPPKSLSFDALTAQEAADDLARIDAYTAHGKTEAMKTWTKALTPDEAVAMRDWSERGYDAVRFYQVNGKPLVGTAEQAAKRVQDIESAFDKAPSFRGRISRGIRIDDKLDIRTLYPEGGVIETEAITSFSSSEQAARNFAMFGDPRPGGIMRRGRKVVWNVEGAESGKSIGRFAAFDGEYEVVLPKGAKLRIQRVTELPDGNVVVDLKEIIAQKAAVKTVVEEAEETLLDALKYYKENDYGQMTLQEARELLPALTREEQDALFWKLQRSNHVWVVEDTAPRLRTPEEIAAQMVGGEVRKVGPKLVDDRHSYGFLELK